MFHYRVLKKLLTDISLANILRKAADTGVNKYIFGLLTNNIL